MQFPSSPFSQQQPLHTLPSPAPVPFSHPHSQHLARSSPFAAQPSPSHSVAFGAVPGSQPGVLGWGVGMSAANGAGRGFGAVASGSGASPFASGSRSSTPQPATATVGWGSAAPASSPSHSQQQQATPSTSRRRRRSATPPSSDDDDDEGHGLRQQQAKPVRPVVGKMKRARTAGEAGGLSAGGLNLGGGGAGGGAPAVGDLGKALASLDKPSLLSLLHQLLTSQPSLAPTISALLPAPSLPTLLTSLAALERAVLTAIPAGAFLREEYVWGRVRAQVDEYVGEARRFLSLCVPPTVTAAATSEGAAAQGEDLTHPSLAFQFLHALTLSLTRLESALPPPPSSSSSTPASNPNPNPLAAHLLPALLNAWHLFLTRLSQSTNVQGRVFPQSLLLSWFAGWDELCLLPPSPLDAFRGAAAAGGGGGSRDGQGGVRRLMEGVRERARREVGWLVGWREPQLVGAGQGQAGGQGGMEGVEEEL
ncbi:hypothetical protein JCM6882_003164 [Rhodosporidiobolus microsporus]